MRTVVFLGLLKVGLSPAGLLASGLVDRPWQPVLYLIHVLVFAGAGLWLMLLGRSDRRAVSLGIFFLLCATAFSDQLLSHIGRVWPAASTAVRVAVAVQVASYLPYFLWIFVRDFPVWYGEQRRSNLRTFLALMLVLGHILLLCNLIPVLFPGWGTSEILREVLGRTTRDSWFWPLLLLPIVAALLYSVRRTARTSPDERRRVRIVALGLTLGSLPLILVSLLAVVWRPLREYLASGSGVPVLGLLVYPALLSIPFTTAYAVLVHRALDVRLIVRRVVQYALARYSLVLLTVAPFLFAAVLLYGRREATVSSLLSGPAGAVLLGTATAGALALWSRPQLVAALDRRFFREQYDSRRILGDLVQRCRVLRDPAAFAPVVQEEIDRALHLHRVELLLADVHRGVLFPPHGALPELGLESRLVRRMEAGEVLEIDWNPPSEWLAALPEPEQQWVADAGIQLLVPVLDGRGMPLAALALGEKRSELPFSGEDRLLLTTVAGSIALALESRGGLAGLHSPSSGAELPAGECPACGLVAAADARECPRCGRPTATSAVPLVLAGKFRMLERIGRGGMGVVYRALDVGLDREVAVKTLPRVSPGEVVRLRQEARAMAAVSHTHLALILGAESWHGVPMLIVEYLPDGTLGDRLERGPLPLPQALGLGIGLASALARLHQAGILHRDIKPTNIGYAGDGTPKLLDFGVARVLAAAHRGPPFSARWQSLELTPTPLATAHDELVGTVPYLSPEAVGSGAANPQLDLWALSVVLYESIAGRHPLADASWPGILQRIAEADLPDIRRFVPEAPPAVAEFFQQALSPDRRRRPGSARELEARLRDLAAAVVPSHADPPAGAAGAAH